MPITKVYKGLLHSFLFLLTLLTCTLSGAEWMTGKSFLFSNPAFPGLGWAEFWSGLHYSVPFLLILTSHEFGHYFVARYHGLRVSLPYYIPIWFGGISPSIGTMGAFIRINSFHISRMQFFDVGIAGPLAGFALALGVLYYGFTHLPAPEHIFTIHPEYIPYGLDYADHVYKGIENQGGVFRIGSNLLFEFFKTLAPSPQHLPHPNEMIHYPYLLAGYLALFFTAMNLIPIGQLDGGHILYGLVGKKIYDVLSPLFFFVLVFYGGFGLFSMNDATKYLLTYAPVYVFFLFIVFGKVFDLRRNAVLAAVAVFTLQFALKSFVFTEFEGYYPWMVLSFVIGRVLGVYHPETTDDSELSLGRKILGWLALIIFVISFSPTPFEVS